MGLCADAGDQLRPGNPEAMRMGSGLSLADRTGSGELPHAVGFPGGEARGSRRVVLAIAGRVEQRRAGEFRTSDLRWDQDQSASQWQELSSREDVAGALGMGAATGEGSRE